MWLGVSRAGGILLLCEGYFIPKDQAASGRRCCTANPPAMCIFYAYGAPLCKGVML